MLHKIYHEFINHKLQDNTINKVTHKTTQMDNHTTLIRHLIHTATTNFKSFKPNHKSIHIKK